MINAAHTGDDEPLYTVRMEGNQTVVVAPVELLLSAGPLLLTVEFRIEFDEHNFDGVRSPGLSTWWGTVGVTEIPVGLWQSLGSVIAIRTRAGFVTRVLVSSIEAPRAAGNGIDIQPSIVRLDGDGPFLEFPAEEQRALDVTGFA